MSTPTSSPAWIVKDNKSGFAALSQETVPVPSIAPHEVLVEMKAASLNFRDLAIPNGLYPFRTPSSYPPNTPLF